MNRLLSCTILFLLLLLLNHKTHSQTEPTKPIWWASFSAGAFPESNFSLIFDLNFSFEESSFIFLMGDYRTDEIGDRWPRYESMGSTLGIGKIWNDRLVMMSLSTGLSLDFVMKEDFFYDEAAMQFINNKTQGLDFGLPIRMYTFIKSGTFGIGLHAMYKFTLYDSYGSIGLSIALGNLRHPE